MYTLAHFGCMMVLWSAEAGATAGDLHSQLEGGWKLTSAEQVLTDGTRRASPLYGPGGVSHLIFANDNERSMCTLIDRSPSKEGMDAYCGRYELNEAEQFVVFDIEMGTVRTDIDDRLRRYISIDRDTLKLRTTNPYPNVVEFTLTWQRFSN